jgi:uncharacterized membrane protein YdjX (TVP38/TMEM64 family)
MDATARRAVLITLGLFVVVAAILVLGRFVILGGGSGEGVFAALQTGLASLRDHPAGLPASIALFCALAFLGAPQFALIAIAVVAFGPAKGFAYAWISTLTSATLTFWIGRWSGESLLRRYGGKTVTRLSKFVGRNDFLASMIVRNVPTAPFIVVNMAFGVSHAVYWRFLAGLAIGVIPKTALVAFGGEAVRQAVEGSPLLAIGAIIAAIVIWIGIMLFARSRMPSQNDDTASQT